MYVSVFGDVCGKVYDLCVFRVSFDFEFVNYYVLVFVFDFDIFFGRFI